MLKEAAVQSPNTLPETCALARDEAVRIVHKHVHALRAQIGAVRSEDPDGIHDMRVASRRLRATLTEFAPLFEWAALKRFRKDIRAVTRGLGKPRELDVTLSLIEVWGQRLPKASQAALATVQTALRAKRKAESNALAAIAANLESSEFQRNLDQLLGSIRPPTACHREHGEKGLSARIEKLTQFHHQWTEHSDDESLHQLRIAFKKLRYASETYAPNYGPEINTFIQSLKRAQTSLGQWNDLRVLRDHLLSTWDSAPSANAPAVSVIELAIGIDVARLLGDFSRTAIAFFSPEALRSNRELFASPKRPCCR